MNPRRWILAFVLIAFGVAPRGAAQTYWSNQSPAGITDDIWSVTYANGTFAAVTSRGNLLTSADGLLWTTEAIDPGVWLVSIAFGNGTWVVVGDKGTILLSTDLKTWVNARSATTNRLNGVLYNGSYYGPFFIAVGENGTILTSPDAQTWTARDSHVTGYLHGITFDPDFAVTLVSGQNGSLLETTDGITFTPVPSGTTQDLEAVVYQTEDAPFVTAALGSGGTIITNTYGLVWTNPWSRSAVTHTTARLVGLTFGNDSFVAVGEQGTILASPDGKTWTQRLPGDSPSTLSTATLLGAAFADTLQRFVVTGTGGTILISNAPPTMLANVSTRGLVSSTQSFIGGFVIEGKSPRKVLIRADGPALGTFGVSNTLPDPVLTIFNSYGTVVATNTGWTTNASPTAVSNAAIAVGAFPLPNPSPDSALFLTLQPGAYTAVISSANGSSGIALFEAYTN